MRGRLEIVVARAELPEGAGVGDVVKIECEARIFAIEEDLIDVTPAVGPTQYVPGERMVKVQAIDARLFPVNA